MEEKLAVPECSDIWDEKIKKLKNYTKIFEKDDFWEKHSIDESKNIIHDFSLLLKEVEEKKKNFILLINHLKEIKKFEEICLFFEFLLKSDFEKSDFDYIFLYIISKLINKNINLKKRKIIAFNLFRRFKNINYHEFNNNKISDIYDTIKNFFFENHNFQKMTRMNIKVFFSLLFQC
jgi:hypothetical protein